MYFINMTREQLGKKLKMTKGAMQKIEEREASGQITVNKLRTVAQGLNMKLVYGFIPNDGSIENLISIKSERLAKKIVLRTNQNMKLEDQGIGDEKNLSRIYIDGCMEIFGNGRGNLDKPKRTSVIHGCKLELS